MEIYTEIYHADPIRITLICKVRIFQAALKYLLGVKYPFL